MHYRHSDEEKFRSLGKFLYENYRQSLLIIADNQRELAKMRALRPFADKDFPVWLDEEREYMAKVGKEPPENKLACLYVDALEDLARAR